MKDYLLNQLIVDTDKKSNTPDIDQYLEHHITVENRKNKRLTNKVFRTQVERKLFLKVYSKMRKKLRDGNQYDVASELKKHFTLAHNSGLFRYMYFYEQNQKIDELTGLNVAMTDLEISEQRQKYENELNEQFSKRCEFLENIGLTRYCYTDFFYNREVLVNYFYVATPAAIVQMKKRLSRKNIPKNSR